MCYCAVTKKYPQWTANKKSAFATVGLPGDLRISLFIDDGEIETSISYYTVALA